MKKRLGLILFIAICFLGNLWGQEVAVKTNFLYLGTTTPNIGLDFRTGEQTSLSFLVSYNPFKFDFEEEAERNPKLKHWAVMPEFKYWFCKTFERDYIGIHGIYGHYNVGGISFVPFLKEQRYEGDAYGGGVSYGYQWALGGRWGLEASLGAGFLYLEYDKYDAEECGEFLGRYSQNYMGITKASIAIIYFIR